MSKFECVVSADLMRRAQAAVSTEETRYYLGGVHIEACPEGGALLVATDGHKLLAFRDPDGLVSGSAIVRLNAATVKALKPAKSDSLGERFVSVSGDRAAVVLGLNSRRDEMIGLATAPDASCVAVQFADTLIDGTFPDWRRAIPTFDPAQPVTATFNAGYIETLAQALAPTGQRSAFARIVAKGPSVEAAATGPHLMFAAAPLEGFAVIMPIRDCDGGQDAAPSWIASAPEPLAVAA